MSNLRPPSILLFHVAGEPYPEHERMAPEPDQLTFHLPAIDVGGMEKRLYAGILGNAGEGVR